MHVHLPESLIVVMYLDSLFAEHRERETRAPAPLPATLSRLYLQAMREHDRKALLRQWRAGAWQAVPDWRFDRQVIRLALYLRERVGVGDGDRVAIVSELRPEWLVADFAASGLGAIAVGIDPDPPEALAGALVETAPRVTVVSAPGWQALEAGGARPHAGQVIALDPVPAGDEAIPLAAALDLGGILDTAERAQSFRARARDLAPEAPAVQHYCRDAGGGLEPVELSQGEVIERLRRDWLRHPAQPGDVGYVTGPAVTLAARLALYAWVGDGYTTAVLGTPGRELAEIAELRPHKVVVPAALLAEVMARRAGADAGGDGGADGGWLDRAVRLLPGRRARRHRQAAREAFGGQARWIGPTDRIDPALLAQLGDLALVGEEQRDPREGGGL